MTEQRHTGAKIHILSKKSQIENHIIQEIHSFKIAFFTKITFSKSQFSQKSQFQNHMFSQKSPFQNLIFHKNRLFKIRTREKSRKLGKIRILPGFSDSNKVLPQFYDPVQPDQHDASQCQMPMSTSNFDLLSSMPLVPFHVHPYVTTFWDCLRQLSKQLSLKLSFSFVFEKRRKSVKVWTENVVGWLGKQVCSLTSFGGNNVCQGSLKKKYDK